MKSWGILDYQLDQLKELQYDFRRKIGGVAQQARERKLDADGRQKLFLETLAEVDKEIAEILLPHQATRLKQIAFQSLGLTPDGTVSIPNMLGNPMMRSQLSLSQSTLDKLREKLKEENERLVKEIAQLKKESRERILNSLSAKDKETLQEIIGPVFDFRGYTPSASGRFRKASEDDH